MGYYRYPKKGSGGGGGAGTVTSVGLSYPSTNVFNVGGSPVTTAGTLAVTFTDPGANKLLGWDDTDNDLAYFTLGLGFTYTHSTHSLVATGVLIGRTSDLISNPTPSVSSNQETALGESAGLNSAISFNCYFGYQAGMNTTAGSFSIYHGYKAGFNATNSERSLFIGSSSGAGATNAKHCIFIGALNAGNGDTVNNTVSGWNILLGSSTSTGGFQNSILIGSHISVIQSNTRANQFMLVDSVTAARLRGIEYNLPSTTPTALQVLQATSVAAGIATLGWVTFGLSGTANQVAYFTGAATVASSNQFLWNPTTKIFKVGDISNTLGGSYFVVDGTTGKASFFGNRGGANTEFVSWDGTTNILQFGDVNNVSGNPYLLLSGQSNLLLYVDQTFGHGQILNFNVGAGTFKFGGDSNYLYIDNSSNHTIKHLGTFNGVQDSVLLYVDFVIPALALGDLGNVLNGSVQILDIANQTFQSTFLLGQNFQVTDPAKMTLNSDAFGQTVVKASLVAQSGAQTVYTYTDPTSGSDLYEVGGYVNITSLGGDTVGITVSFTDETGNPVSIGLGSTSALGASPSRTFVFRVQQGTVITATTTVVTGFAVYNASAYLAKR